LLGEDAAVEQPIEADGLEQLYREHRDRLWHAVFAYTGNREIAHDAVAEAFTQGITRESELRDPLAWIWRVAFRVAAGALKEQRRSVGEPREQHYEIPLQATEVFEALRHLTRKQRAAVVLHHYAGYPVKEIASILGSTPAAVRVHLSAGRRRLRGLLEDDDE
jgi:RNA polymerase sigma-70 factor (ECF subfamily)